MLASDRWARVRALLEEVVDLSPGDRRSYLAEACNDAPDVREEVESLLGAHDAAGAFLEPARMSSDAEGAPADRVPVLEPGTRLGCFQVISTLGAGGMGEVYCARDTRLDRSVAIKVLLPELAADPDYRERFEREARAISRLSHQHICVLYDVGRASVDGHGGNVERQFLVMELLDGETLAARLRRGPLPLDQALTYGIQIAEALAAAHTQDIVHRDLKPSNIMLTKGGVKLLDFGLARLRGSATADAGADASGVTNARPIVGTLPYMSPEHVRGESADARSDIFAFGAVLYEMIAGTQAFAADSRAGLVAMILERDPPSLSDLQPSVPPTLDRLVRTCLAKDPTERWQHAHDLVLALKGLRDLNGAPQPVRPNRPSRVTIAGWALAAAASVALAVIILARTPAATPRDAVARRLMFDAAPVRTGNAWSPAVSSDGRTVAFLGARDTAEAANLYIRHLDTGETRQLTYIRDFGCGWGASWSSDGRTLLYLLLGRLRAVDPATGSDRVLAEATTLPRTLCAGVTQSADGTIVIGGTQLQLLLPGQQVFRGVSSRHPSVTLQVWPSFLPNGRDFLFAQAATDPSHQGVFLASLDSDQVIRVLPAFSNAVVASTGQLVYGREGSILAQPFDQARGSVTGEPTVLASGVTSIAGYTHFAVGAGHTLVYVPQEEAASRDLVWYRPFRHPRRKGRSTVRLSSNCHVAGRATRWHRVRQPCDAERYAAFGARCDARHHARAEHDDRGRRGHGDQDRRCCLVAGQPSDRVRRQHRQRRRPLRHRPQPIRSTYPAHTSSRHAMGGALVGRWKSILLRTGRHRLEAKHLGIAARRRSPAIRRRRFPIDQRRATTLAGRPVAGVHLGRVWTLRRVRAAVRHIRRAPAALDRGRRPAEVARRRARAVLLRARRHDDERQRAAWGDWHASPAIPFAASAERGSR